GPQGERGRARAGARRAVRRAGPPRARAGAAGARGTGGGRARGRRRARRPPPARAPVLAHARAPGDGDPDRPRGPVPRRRRADRGDAPGAAPRRAHPRDRLDAARPLRGGDRRARGGAGAVVSAGAVEVEVAGGVGWVRLARPEKRNAITRAMRTELAEVFAALDADEAVRVAVLTGTGSAFCAGVDLTERAPADPAAPRLTAPLATFAVPEVRIGSLPGSGGVVRLRAAAPAVAAWMVFTGEPIDAAEALRAGLVAEVVEPDALAGRVAALATAIAANAPLSLRAAKAVLRSGSLDEERALWAELATTEDRAEG